jgi:hypothetical protein
MDELIYLAKIVSGKLILDRTKIANDVHLLSDMEVEVRIRKKKRIRSSSMNSYYWAEVVPKVQAGLRDFGEKLNMSETDEWIKDYFSTVTKDHAHEFVKDRFIEKILVDEDTGEVIKNEVSTKRMSTSEFQDYISDIVRFSAEHLHVEIMMPNEQSKIEL